LRSLNICPSFFIFGALAVSFSATAWALDPAKAASQYLRDQWTAERGFPGGPVSALAQTRDGYLWVGTEAGLFHFDGVNFSRVREPDPASPMIDQVLGLIVDDAGELFARLPNPSLLHQTDGAFAQVSLDPDNFDSRATALARARTGDVLISSRTNGLVAFSRSRFRTLVSSDSLPSSLINSIAGTSVNDVWFGTRDQGLFHLQGNRITPIPIGAGELKINCLLSGDKGELWVGTDQGIRQWNGRELIRPAPLAPLAHQQITALIEDRDSNIWIGTRDRGLIRWNANGLAYLDPFDGAGRPPVNALFEDREGDLWSGTSNGIERLRDRAFITYPAPRGENNGPVYADSSGRIWWGPASGGLRWLTSEGKVHEVTQAGLDKDVIYSITGKGDDLWVGRQHGGVTRLHLRNGSFQSEIYTHADGLAANGVFAVTQSTDGALWAGTLNAGVSRIQRGGVTTYRSDDGLGSDTVNAIIAGRDGAMWFATPKGLTSFSQGQWRLYRLPDSLPAANVNCVLEDSAGVLWLGTSRGIAVLDADRISVPPGLPSSLSSQIFGMAEDKIGSLWIVTSDRLLRVARDRLMRGALEDGDLREYGLADGVPMVEGIKRDRSIVADPSGRIWISTNQGVAVGDPARLARNSVLTLVRIESISADGIPVSLAQPRIPAATRRIAIRYRGLNLSAPERIRFRFMLDGFDHGWNLPLDGNEAFYTNLGPGPYRFHLAASNPDGAWNGEEAAIALRVDPSFWQTWWFRVSFAGGLILTVLILYRLRLRQVSRQLSIRFDERLTERNRIARELHDTLLQTIQGSKMVADDALDAGDNGSPDPERMRCALEKLNVWLTQAVEEGRSALNSLRSLSPEADDLTEAFERAARECMNRSSVKVVFSVEGSVKPVHAIARDEIYHIGYEAIRNACNHSGGSLLEVELNFTRNLELRVRDNGTGIDPAVAANAKQNHFGLTGMSERAARVGGKLSLFTSANGGTEVELIVPGNIAFGETVPSWKHAVARVRRLF
jgi:ligand-binding sensor domain-containing protein/signal transduction histidine kinase